jgi:hypothetical protein
LRGVNARTRGACLPIKSREVIVHRALRDRVCVWRERFCEACVWCTTQVTISMCTRLGVRVGETRATALPRGVKVTPSAACTHPERVLERGLLIIRHGARCPSPLKQPPLLATRKSGIWSGKFGEGNHGTCTRPYAIHEKKNAQRKVSLVDPWCHTCLTPSLVGSFFMLDVRWSKITHSVAQRSWLLTTRQ